jgi:hypothetical protein
LTDDFTFEFGILNTPNRWWKIPDYVFEEDFFSDTTFVIDDAVYSLRLLGFGDAGGLQTEGYSDYLKSNEGRTRRAGLYAQIDQVVRRDGPPNQVILRIHGVPALWLAVYDVRYPAPPESPTGTSGESRIRRVCRVRSPTRTQAPPLVARRRFGPMRHEPM